MTTALDLIKSAMKKAGILTKTEPPSADEAKDGLSSLNAMLDSWANESLNVPYRTLESFTLLSGAANYTIGTGGDFNTSRPVSIVSAYIRDGDTDYPLTIISDEAYMSFSDKSTEGIPECINFNNAFPLATIRLYPVPQASYQIHLLTEKTIGNYSLSSTVSLPPGWERAIVHQLAVEIAPEYGVQIPEEVAVIAVQSMSNIRRAVAKNRPIDTPMGGGSGDIFSGYN